MDMTVTYTLTDDNAVIWDLWAVSDADTIINPCNHNYFNLDGHTSGTILAQKVWVDSDSFVPTDDKLIPTGEIATVEGTPMDFRVLKAIGQDIDAEYEPLILAHGYDHNWCLKNNGQFMKVAELVSENSGITMEVSTDRPGLQLYTGNFLNDEAGKQGAVYPKNGGITFETQEYPDAINQKNFPSPILKKGEEFKSRTEYKFIV